MRQTLHTSSALAPCAQSGSSGPGGGHRNRGHHRERRRAAQSTPVPGERGLLKVSCAHRKVSICLGRRGEDDGLLQHPVVERKVPVLPPPDQCKLRDEKTSHIEREDDGGPVHAFRICAGPPVFESESNLGLRCRCPYPSSGCRSLCSRGRTTLAGSYRTRPRFARWSVLLDCGRLPRRGRGR